MSLKIITGGSGSGKSTYVYENIIRESEENPKKNYLILVPDQFTMQTQMDLVKMSKRGGIMNIDVLSFSRLAHRIFEETGGQRKPVLDDTGKSLVLCKVAGTIKDDMPVIGGNLGKIGYIHEMKSAISEFMQYGIGQAELKQLTDYAKKRGVLHYKLKDLQVAYKAFNDYIKENYITTEESMDLLASRLYQSKLMKDSIVVLDGFTGFTPIQNKVITALLKLCAKVIVTVSIDGREDPNEDDGEQKLFFFGKKTVRDLKKLAKEADVEIEEDLCLGKDVVYRFAENEQLAFLEKNIFRHPMKTYAGTENGSIKVTAYKDPKREIRGICQNIRRILKHSDCTYGDIALIAGDLGVYESVIEEVFADYEIPLFMDKTNGILLNPFTEFLKAALSIRIKDFSYDAVFHYLRSGLADFTKEEIDDLENYVLELGIRGKKAWTHVFSARNEQMKKSEDGLAKLEYFNALRSRLLAQLAPILEENLPGKQLEVGTIVRRLYEFVVLNNIENKLASYASYFEEKGELKRAKEYEQIYRMIMNLFDEIMDLIGKETTTLKEFEQILTAGFDEIEVGSIPRSVDRVIVGDMERTRLKPVKYLFFLGVNDGAIPKKSSKGGIISDIDREFLSGSGMSLAPTPREQIFIQKYYLYLNMTKPTQGLFISYACMDLQGNAVRPSYLIRTMEKMFPKCSSMEQETDSYWDIGNMWEAKESYCDFMRQYAEGSILPADMDKMALLEDLMEKEDERKVFIEKIASQAFFEETESVLDQAVVNILYGESILGSVSRMEQYAKCAYAYFLKYGLQLKEREEYGFEDRDIGNIFHGVLELFSRKLEENSYTWFDFPAEEGKRFVKEAMEDFCTSYTDALLYENATNRYNMARMERILNRTVETISYQLNKGKFKPFDYEVKFSVVENLQDVDVTLSKDEKMRLLGKIDRVDTWENDDKVYVKVVDYKSGNKDFNLAAFYYGTQLQMVVYLNEAQKVVEKRIPGKEPVGAALLYYHVADPIAEGTDQMEATDINQKIRESLRTKGLVLQEDEVIEAMDNSGDKKSDCIPVERKKDGSFTAASKVFVKEDMQLISDYATFKLKKIGADIKKGKISKNPVILGTEDSCTYCSYKGVCSFDEHLPGYKKMNLEKDSSEEILIRMKEDLEKNKEAEAK